MGLFCPQAETGSGCRSRTEGKNSVIVPSSTDNSPRSRLRNRNSARPMHSKPPNLFPLHAGGRCLFAALTIFFLGRKNEIRRHGVTSVGSFREGARLEFFPSLELEPWKVLGVRLEECISTSSGRSGLDKSPRTSFQISEAISAFEETNPMTARLCL